MSRILILANNSDGLYGFRRELLTRLAREHEVFASTPNDGYFDELIYFHSGFVFLAEKCLKNGMDLPVFLAYYRKKDRKFIFDKPLLISELLKLGDSRESIAEKIRLRCNELGHLNITA